MSHAQLAQIIDTAFENRAEINFDTRGEVRDAVETALNLLDNGEVRVAEKVDGEWKVNQWLKRAVLLSFRQVRRLERKPVARLWLPGRPRCHRPQVGLYRQERHPHAQLRQSRRLCR
jgi:hypothetical protein